ncbi:hypothetical protein BDU57DRAFT_224582 [Ampelomyces quisqualis]|uniref:Uncharacterized protein n=1 Tax=Ampelomyces quisqualis TaxID=50730 RepID=A0A6A5QKX7_AMPQU|nr:hypothetical protein BDU57DRAFT_224582 [Ampelomyces quisqualis]
MTSAMATKVTSLGSQSGSETQHHSTPVAEALESGAVVPLPLMDFAAVTKILEPIQETLNESAHDATYPSPPGNTPLIGSPAPSVKPGVHGRARGFSAIGDRLAQLKLDDRRSFRRRQTCVACSGRSVGTSAAEENDDSDMASNSEVFSDGCKDKDCDVHPGSPAANPRIEEFLSFSSNDLPNHAPAPAKGTTLAEHASSTSAAALHLNGQQSHLSFKSDGGVTEKSNWAEEVEDSFERACLGLEQLAMDEYAADPSKTLEVYYISRMRRLLGSLHRKVPMDVNKVIGNSQ